MKDESQRSQEGGNYIGPNTKKILVKIQEIVKICIPFFKSQFKKNNYYYKTKTSHPGNIYILDDKKITNIEADELSFLNFQLSSVKIHSMKGYISTLKKNLY